MAIRPWYIIAQDYAAGHALEQNARQIVAAGGGTVLGSTFHPLGETDYSAYLIRAASSGAKLIMMTAGGSDLINELKQAQEFNIAKEDEQSGRSTLSLPMFMPSGLRQCRG